MAGTSRHIDVFAAGVRGGIRRHARVGESATSLKSDLSVSIEITTEELDAIARLLGDDLKCVLSKVSSAY